MQQKDVALVVVVAIIGVVISYFLCDNLLPKVDGLEAKFSTIDEITANLAEPNEDVFNEDAINPTVEVYTTGQNSGV